MTDSMNFGPEWLRTLSQAPVQVPPPRYQLAEFRYGREEMLALFSTTLVPPEPLKQVTGLFVKEAQTPLALITMSDEETRMWNRGINSDAVLRSGKGGGGRGRGRGTGGPGGGGPGIGGGGIGYYGRGGSSGPPGSELTSRPTGPGGGLGGPIGPYDESDIGFARSNRPFDRSQSERSRDSWSERNGAEGRGGGGRHSSENWRRGGRGPVSGSGGGEEDEWRPAAKWSMTSERPYTNRGRANSGNWRDDDNWDPMPHSKSNNHHLPEWATEKNSEGGGTFDATGAFRSADGFIDDDERQSHLKRTRKSSSSKSPHEPGSELRKCQDGDDDSCIGNSGGGDSSSWSPGGGGVPDDRGEDERPGLAADFPDPDIKEPMNPPPSKERPKPGPGMDPSSLNQKQQSQSESLNEPPPPIPMANSLQKSVQHKTPVQPQSPQPSTKHFSAPPQHLPLSDALSDDPLGHMTDDIAAEFVAKLMEEEENKDKQWYYRDPQGQVQGPFSCAEMAEWFQSGYFTLNLLVRRACDPNYAPLGELIKLWGCIPFLPEPHPLNEEVANVVASRQVQDNLVMAQYHQHCRNLVLKQQSSNRVPMSVPPPNKMPHEWMERQPPPMMDQNLPAQYQPQQPPPQVAHLASNNSLRALLAQMQQQQQQLQQQQHQQLQQQARMPYPRTTEEISQKVSDFLRLLQAKSDNGVMRPPQLSSPSGATAPAGIPPQHVPPPPGPPQQPPGTASSPGVMETLLSLHQHQQMTVAQAANMAGSPSPAPAPANPSPVHNFLRQMQTESVWNGGNWNQWSHVSTKGIKTEQEVLEEQLRAEDERKSEEAREQSEKFITATSKSKKSDKTKLKEQQQQQQMVEKTMREMRETEDMRRQEEEEIRRKQEASRRAEVERQKKGEEKRKKDEEKRKKEEEKKERDRLKEEERKKREAEEAKKKAADLMAKVQRSQWCPPAASDTSILDIQRSEREQQMLRGLQQQLDAAEQQQQQQKIGSKLQLNWNRQMVQHDVSLAEIQAEERQYMKEKQEREKEKAAQQQQQSNPVGGSLSGWWQNNPWGSTPAWSSSINPITSGSSNQQQSSTPTSTSNNFTSGFWEQLTSNGSSLSKNQNGAQVNNSEVKTSSTSSAPGGNAKPQQPQYNSGSIFQNSQQQQQQQQQQPQQPNNQQQGSKESKSKTKRDEMAVLKLFSTSTNDEFSQWCTEALSNIQSSVDIPTFIGFLRDLESAQDVQDYIRVYLGETKEATDFARQFLERRRHASGGLSSASGGGNSSSSAGGGITGSSPPSLSNSNQDFQQVKAKNKKKKGRMQKVDSRILNFSTTSASGRINVGDRQYPEE